MFSSVVPDGQKWPSCVRIRLTVQRVNAGLIGDLVILNLFVHVLSVLACHLVVGGRGGDVGSVGHDGRTDSTGEFPASLLMAPMVALSSAHGFIC